MAAASTNERRIAGRLIARLEDDAKEREVSRVCIGLGYTGLVLDDGNMGLAYTFRREAPGGCTLDMALRPLGGRRASELLPLLVSENRIEAGLALACANALVGDPVEGVVEGDILDRIDVGPGDDVGMVGYFGPLIGKLRARARSLTVFEKREVDDGEVLPPSEAVRMLPGFDVVLVTSTSILNHTVDDLLEACTAARQVVMLGASTPLLPAAFSDTPVTLLSGVVPRAPARILEILAEAGGMQLFGKHVRKVNVRVG